MQLLKVQASKDAATQSVALVLQQASVGSPFGLAFEALEGPGLPGAGLLSRQSSPPLRFSSSRLSSGLAPLPEAGPDLLPGADVASLLDQIASGREQGAAAVVRRATQPGAPAPPRPGAGPQPAGGVLPGANSQPAPLAPAPALGAGGEAAAVGAPSREEPPPAGLDTGERVQQAVDAAAGAGGAGPGGVVPGHQVLQLRLLGGLLVKGYGCGCEGTAQGVCGLQHAPFLEINSGCYVGWVVGEGWEAGSAVCTCALP